MSDWGKGSNNARNLRQLRKARRGMKTSHMLVGAAAAAGVYFVFLRKVDAKSGVVTLTAGKRYQIDGHLFPAPTEVKNIMAPFGGSPAVLQARPDGTFTTVFDAQQPFAVPIGVPQAGAVTITIDRVREV